MLALATIAACTALLLQQPHLAPRRAHQPRVGPRGPRLASVEDWLREPPSDRHSPVDDSLSSVILALFGACQHGKRARKESPGAHTLAHRPSCARCLLPAVAGKIATASCDSTSCFSERVTDEEEEMLAIDLLAEEVLFDALSATGHVAVASSESDKVYRHLTLLPPPADDDHHEDMGPPPPPMYSVALDPLDSCSIIDANFAVGTIFGVWETTSLVNVTGRQLVAAGACTYGPRTAITLALDGRPDVYEFLLINEQWRLSNTYANIGEGKLFAPGNLRATACNPGYARLVEYWQSSQYTLRYTGGLVPDVTQLLVKGKVRDCARRSRVTSHVPRTRTLSPLRAASLCRVKSRHYRAGHLRLREGGARAPAAAPAIRGDPDGLSNRKGGRLLVGRHALAARH